MRALPLTLVVALLLVLPATAVADGPDNARLEELWKTGSLWQVGDNIPKVDAARKEIVAAGAAGLAFIFTKLDTTDGLQFRCLEAVFKGFGSKALPGLYERIAHEDVKVRRNVAAMLGVIDDKSAAAKMVEHLKRESDLRCKVGHLQTLARWKEPTALDPLIECTRVTQQQEPLAERLKVRIVPLLGNYDVDREVSRKAGWRLIELLDDDAYFVRNAALAGLLQLGRGGGLHDAMDCLRIRCRDSAFVKPPNQTFKYLRRCISAIAELAPKGYSAVFKIFVDFGLNDCDDALLRADVVRALPVYWRALDKQFDPQWNGKRDDAAKELEEVIGRLRGKLKTESDPYALCCLERAVDELEVIRRAWPKD